MNDLTDKPLHNWVRQSLTDYEPAVDTHESEQDWQLLRPRLFPRRRRPVLWFWLLGLVGLMGGLGWYFSSSKPTKNAPLALKTLILRPPKPAITTNLLPKITVAVPEKISASEVVAACRQSARRVPDEATPRRTKPSVLPETPLANGTPAPTGLLSMASIQAVKTTARTWPAVAHRTLSPPEQALEDKLLSGEIGADSTVFAALSRNLQQWPNAVIVCDLTTSMDPYAVQIYAWFRRNAKNPNVNGVVFFTDCDSLGQQTRPNGPPGAFFTTREHDPRVALPTLLAAARNTTNNRDGDENVVEALCYAQRTFPNARHFVLLADNGSGVKDMPLLVGLKKPVHVIACGPSFNETNAFQNDQYQIALKTGGTMHTLEDDFSPNRLTRGTFVRVDNHYYRYSHHKKRFVKTRFERRPIRVLGLRL